MPCDTRIPEGMTAEQRAEQIRKALEGLEAQLATGEASLKVAPNGGVVFSGWSNRSGVNDACAFRAFQQANSFELRRALATAEAQAGRKVDAHAIGHGLHSHDGGNTWGHD